MEDSDGKQRWEREMGDKDVRQRCQTRCETEMGDRDGRHRWEMEMQNRDE